MNRMKSQTSLVRCGMRLPTHPLSIADVQPGGVVMRRAAAFTYRIDLERLSVSLRECLAELPLFCGRLTATDDGRWKIDGNDAGLRYTVVEVDEAMPPYGYGHSMKPDLKRLTEPLSFAPVDRDVPLVGIRVTRFRDGTTIGISNAHSLMDGTSAWIFLERWSQHFRGRPPPTSLTFDRAPLLKYSAVSEASTWEDPLPDRPLSRLGFAGFVARSLLTSVTGETAVFHLPAAALAQAKARLSERLPAGEWISTQDAAMSVLVQAVAAATTCAQLQIGTVYDFRAVSGLGLSRQYIANATTSRMFRERATELVREPVTVARTLRRLSATVTEEHVRADLSRLQARITPESALRWLPKYVLEQFKDGLLLNNYSRFSIYGADFGGGPPAWGDYPRLPLNRVITLCPDPTHDGVAVHLTLSRAELRRFVRPEGAGRWLVIGKRR